MYNNLAKRKSCCVVLCCVNQVNNAGGREAPKWTGTLMGAGRRADGAGRRFDGTGEEKPIISPRLQTREIHSFCFHIYKSVCICFT